MDASSPVKKKRISFLDLPPELRNDIYFFALKRQNAIVIEDCFISKRKKSKFRVEPGLLATCRVVRVEATPVFYGNNTFRTQMYVNARTFLHQLGKDRIAHLYALQLFDARMKDGALIRGGLLGYGTEKRMKMVNELVADISRVGKLDPQTIKIPDGRGSGGGGGCGDSGSREGTWKVLSELVQLEVVEKEDGKWRVEWREPVLKRRSHGGDEVLFPL